MITVKNFVSDHMIYILRRKDKYFLVKLAYFVLSIG